MGEITQILLEIRAGSETARTRLVDLVYEQLRALAGSYMKKQPWSHTLQPTALVHEAFLRLVGNEHIQWTDRAHFFAACAGVMRNILADHARRRKATKRGGGVRQVTLSDSLASNEQVPIDMIALDDALTRLAELNERHARVVECRFFAAMTVPEVAEALGVSARTIDNDWAMARAWLAANLSENEVP
ncbi:MAG: sigma-70 family RNA polymerase sigma factor [Phycisphaerae bacterium]|nr:sigma-70 family RNA polymerase sigma factor [Phycisphaerae bacterium]NUQ45391.1 sigma-70 family RNA polymerase sigma factor [Phycisphaerae bacterium]